MKKPKKLPADANQRAYEIVRLSTEEDEPVEPPPTTEEPRSPISQYLATIGRKGGLKGGKARAENMTPERRKEIARKAAGVRWGKKDESE
jgi:hypothetical protein